MLLLAQAPAIAVVILLVFGRQAAEPVTTTSWPAVAEAIASTMFALAMSAVWLGGSLAAWTSLVGRCHQAGRSSLEARMLASPAWRFAAIGGLLAAQCAVLLAIVHWGSGLKGPWLPMFGVLALASAVGLSLGFLVFSLLRTPVAAVAVLVVAFVAMTAMGGRIWRLSASGPVAPIAAAMPSRWAFEGLLLLEGERRTPPDVPDETAGPDLAEDFFPVRQRADGPEGRRDGPGIHADRTGGGRRVRLVEWEDRPLRSRRGTDKMLSEHRGIAEAGGSVLGEHPAGSHGFAGFGASCCCRVASALRNSSSTTAAKSASVPNPLGLDADRAVGVLDAQVGHRDL